MEKTANEVISERKGPTLQLKRALLPIETYAAREGVSKGIVEECGKLGIVQVRKCKGKVFVIDIPISPYSVFTRPGSAENNEPYNDKANDNTFDEVFNCDQIEDSKKASEDHPEMPETTPASTLLGDEAAFAKKISELAQKVIDDIPETDDDSRQSSDKLTNPGKIFKSIKRILHKIWPIKDKTAENTNNEVEQDESTEPAQIIQVDKPESADILVRLAPLSIKAKKISELIRRVFYSKWLARDEPSDDAKEQAGQDKNISEPVQIEPSEILEIIDEPTAEADQQKQTEDSFEPIHTPDLQELKIVEENEPSQIIESDMHETSEEPANSGGSASRAKRIFQSLKKIFHRSDKVEDKPIETIDDEIIQAESSLEFKQIPQNYGFRFGVLSTQVRSKRIWQVLAIFSLTFLFIAVLSGLWLYMDRKVQLDRLDQYGASIQKVYEDSMQANQRVEILQNELADARVEIERLKSELSSSRAEVKTVRGELTDARQRIETIQQRNSEAVERLNDQIQRLTNRLPGVMESH